MLYIFLIQYCKGLGLNFVFYTSNFFNTASVEEVWSALQMLCIPD